jgi:outer membrane protein TolC
MVTPNHLSPIPGAPVWTVDDVVRLALERNPDIQSARANYQAADATIGEAVSGYLPHADISASTLRTTLPSPSAGSTDQLGISLPYSYAGISIKQTLFDFGKSLNQIQANRALSGAAEQESFAVRNVVSLGARRAFFDVFAADRLEVASEKNLAQVMEIHRRAEVMVHTGARPPFDLTQANVQLAAAKLQLTNAQTERDLAKVALLQVIGVDKQVDFTLKESPSDQPKIDYSKLDVSKLRDIALERRPEMRQADYSVEAAADTVSGQIKDYFPTFSAFGFYGQYLPDYPVALRDAWGVGLGATWNVFNGFDTTFRVTETRAREEQQMSFREKERLNILAEVTSSYVNLLRAESNFKVADEGYESAQENLRLAKKRYEASVGTILELLIAESSLVNSEAAFVQAKYSRAVAFAALQTSVNSTLEDAQAKQ